MKWHGLLKTEVCVNSDLIQVQANENNNTKKSVA